MYYFLFVALYGTVRTNAIYFPKEDRKKKEVIPTHGGAVVVVCVEIAVKNTQDDQKHDCGGKDAVVWVRYFIPCHKKVFQKNFCTNSAIVFFTRFLII